MPQGLSAAQTPTPITTWSCEAETPTQRATCGRSTGTYCTVLYCIVLYCYVLYCMYCTVLYRDGYFGPVCDDDWDYHDAGVVCRCIHLFCDSVILRFVNIMIHRCHYYPQ